MTKEKNTRLSRRQQLAVLGRVLGYMVRHYKFSCLVVVVCILGTALATLAGTPSCRASSTTTSSP